MRWTVVSLSFVFSLTTGILISLDAICHDTTLFKALAVSCQLIYSLYPFIYTITLLAMYNIHLTIKERDYVQIKQATLIQHMVAVTLFVLTGLYNDLLS